MNTKNRIPGIIGLVCNPPKTVLTNEEISTRYPEIISKITEHNLSKLWSISEEQQKELHPLDVSMMPYVADIFKGAKRRHQFLPNETSLSQEIDSAKKAIEVSGLKKEDIDLVMVSSFPPDTIGAGNAAYLVKELGLPCPGINFESACSSSVVGIQLAADLIRGGNYKNILLVFSVSNSKLFYPDDTLSWFLGDGSAAIIIGEIKEEGFGIIGGKTIKTDKNNDMFKIQIEKDRNNPDLWKLNAKASRVAGEMAKNNAIEYLVTCVEAALKNTNLELKNIDFFVFNSPTAWYPEFCGKILGIDPEKYINVYEDYGNIGNCLMPTTLWHVLDRNKVKKGDTVLMYSIGSTSTASTAIMRMNEIKFK